MSYNGSGTFNINTTGQPVVSGTVISSTAFNALTADLANGLTTALTKDGQSTPTANIGMGNYKITNLGAATLSTDAVRYGQLQSNADKLLTVTGTDTMTGTASPALTAYAAGNTFVFVVPNTNTGAATINIDGLGAKSITRTGSTALVAGDMVANQVALIVYDGTRFQLLDGNSFTNLNVSGTITTPLVTNAGTLALSATSTNIITASTNGSERMRIDSSGNLLVGATATSNGGKFLVAQPTALSQSAVFQSTNATAGNNYGVLINYTVTSPNGTSNQFLSCSDSTQVRAEFRSNGGLANFSANNVNLSDVRTKTDIQDASSYLAKICAIPVRTFKYKDQTDDLLNLGCIAQEVETVAPELVDTSGFGKTPDDNIPLKAIYQTDLQYALMKSIQELKALNDTQAETINALTARIVALENA